MWRHQDSFTENSWSLSSAGVSEFLRRRQEGNIVSFRPIPPVAEQVEPFARQQAIGLLLRFVRLAVFSPPDDLEGVAGDSALFALMAGIRRLGVNVEDLKTSEDKLRALLPGRE